MHKNFRVACSLVVLMVAGSSASAAALDPRLVGKWQGMREEGGACQFLSWNSNFMPSGRFEITFFADKERSKKINTEQGAWTADNGKSELTTDGVPTPEAYNYTVIDDDTVKHVNTVKDPSADCQADYEFVERRVKD